MNTEHTAQAEQLPQNPSIAERWRLITWASTRPYAQAWLRRRCQQDPIFWFRWFAWTLDPRLDQPVRPFVLYPFQEALLRRVLTALESGEDVLIEKSRDMGASWVLMGAFLYCWLFRPGQHFLVGSRKMDLVDAKGDPASLLEKARFLLRYLPPWLRPEGFKEDRHAPSGRLLNPENGSSIIGEASTAQFARGGRYRAVLMDEFAFWPQAEQAFTAAGQSSPCRLLVSTPYGKRNKFAQLRFESLISRVTLHWSAHPHKDAAWYERQSRRMSADEQARELDINYHLSVKNRVYNEFTQRHQQRLQVAPNRTVYRVWDFGYHAPACLWAQIDEEGRLLILRELVGEQEVLADFTQRVLATTQAHFAGCPVRDSCDPAGQQVSALLGHNSVAVLNRFGIFPTYEATPITEGIEKVRHLLIEEREGLPALLVDPEACPWTIEAFDGGYRYKAGAPEVIHEEHPYEDVMDCLRYLVWSHGQVLSPKERSDLRRKASYLGRTGRLRQRSHSSLPHSHPPRAG